MSNEGWRRGGGGEANDDGLGSLAQNARKTSLRQARVILFVVGGLTLLFNAFMLATVERQVDQLIEEEVKQLGGWNQVNPAVVKEARATLIRMNTIIFAGTVALGAVFIVLGFLVPKAPVACTVTGLVLYVAGIAVFAVIDPVSLVRGIIIKIFIIIAMVKAVQAAVAYEREAKAETLARDDGASF